MASPQLENGFIKIANELVDAYCRCFPGHGEGRALWFVLRKTYGWHKKEDQIPLSQIVEATGLSRRMAIYCVQNLEAKRMVTVTRKRGRGNVNEINSIAIQKNPALWVVQEKSTQYKKALKTRKLHYENHKARVVQETERPVGVVQETEKTVRFLAPSKETLSKERREDAESDKLIPDSLFPSSKKKKAVPRRAGIPPELQPSVSRIVGRINELGGTRYHEDRPGALKTLLARLNGGETESDCLAVVEDRWQKWGADKTMIEYFNPTTLFREENFAKYLANAQRNGNGNAASKVEFLDNDMVKVDGFTMSRADYERKNAKRQRDA